MEKRTLKPLGLTVGVDSAGPLDAPPIVFLHGASYTRKAWLPQTQSLADEFRVIALDLPGHGQRSETDFDFVTAVSELETLLKSLPRPALLVGVSLGGCIAMEMARRNERLVAGLILSGSTFDPRGQICQIILQGEAITFKAQEELLTRQFQSYVRRHLPSEIADAIVAEGTHWHAAAQAVLQLSGRDFIGCVRHFSNPVLILNGRRDWVHRSAERAFAAAIRTVQIATIPGGGHMSNLDQPEAFTKAVRGFARQIFTINSVMIRS